MGKNQQDFADRLVVFLAKRDGIDKLVKTFQYTSKLGNWYMLQKGNDKLAARLKNWELSSGLSRKAFRTGRFLTGFNAVRNTKYPDWKWLLLGILANSGEVVYFFFDHFTWLSKIGLLNSGVASKSAYLSAFGEVIFYFASIFGDLILLRNERLAELKHREELAELETSLKVDFHRDSSELDATAEKIKGKKAAIAAIKIQRVMRTLSIAANVADFIIDLNDLDPGPFVSHSVTLGISGLVSAWTGWYRVWPWELA